MNPWWLLLIIPASAYAGYIYSNYRWRQVIRAAEDRRPGPSPYREE